MACSLSHGSAAHSSTSVNGGRYISHQRGHHWSSYHLILINYIISYEQTNEFTKLALELCALWDRQKQFLGLTLSAFNKEGQGVGLKTVTDTQPSQHKWQDKDIHSLKQLFVMRQQLDDLVI